MIFETLTLLQLASSVFLAILFLQSGLDKVLDWKGNLSWITGHFSKTIFKNFILPIFLLLTLLELAAGIFSAIGFVFILINGETCWAHWGAILSTLSLLALFFGQRLAKDYPGAGSLVPYFLVCLAALYLY